MKSRGEVVVVLAAGRVSLSIVEAGRVGEARAIRVPVRAGEAFAAGIGALKEPLGRLVAEAGATGMLARVVYSSAEAGAGVFSCAKKAGRAAATSAAALALGESAQLDVSTCPHAMLPLMTDAPVEGGVPQVHTLGVAALDLELSAIMALVEGAGLSFGGATPSAGVGMLSAVGLASSHGGKGVVIVLHVGDHETTIVGEASGRLCFVRQAPIGLETLVEALAREPIADTGGMMHSLDREAARALILRHGVPTAGQAVQISDGVMSTAVLPVLQSTLQRLVVETKQSSRFGLTDAERSGATLRVAGIGSAVPRLGKVVGELAGLPLAIAEAADHTAGLDLDYRALTNAPDVLLFPNRTARSRVVHILKRGLMVGAAASLVVMGASWAKTRFDLVQTESDIASLTQPQATGQQTQALAEKVRVANVYLASTRAAIEHGTPGRVRAEALLVALGEASTASLRLTGLDLDASDGNGSARVNGKVLSVVGEDPTVEIGRFMDRVASSAAVRSCKLASTRRGTGTDEGILFFEMNVELVKLSGSSLATFQDRAEDHR